MSFNLLSLAELNEYDSKIQVTWKINDRPEIFIDHYANVHLQKTSL